MTIAPESLPRRSFLYRELVAAGAGFEEIAGAACAVDLGDPDTEVATARALAICDLSALRRCGYKGPGALDWLRTQGLQIGEHDNLATRQEDGALAARIAPTEAVILGDLEGGGPCPALAAAWSLDDVPGTYQVPRATANAWIAVTGEHAAAMWSKICGVDLRPAKFPDGAIAQTSIARLNGILIRADIGSTLSYHLLVDSAAASYMWRSILDAMDEFAGQPVGLAALRQLQAE